MKKVTILIVLLMSIIMLSGCGNPATSPAKCRQSVVDMYPNAKIFIIDSPFKFIVIDGSLVRSVKTMGFFHPNITNDVIIGVIE